MEEMKPKETVEALDRYIIGQDKAKRSIAIAIRNRWRRQRIEGDISNEIYPKNIIMIGSTGVGKTEIARRMAELIEAPFIKVEATKFTEVGYHGGDVNSIIRNLVKLSINKIETREKENIIAMAQERAEERVLDCLIPKRTEYQVTLPDADDDEAESVTIPDNEETREKFRKKLKDGKLDKNEIEIEMDKAVMPMIEVFSGPGMEEMGMDIQSMFENMGPKGRKKQKMKVTDALRVFIAEESEKLINKEEIVREALERVEQSGIVFIDEIDKIARAEDARRDVDVSREGVQRDLLPLVEGTTIPTRYGNVKTDYILFIAAGAFHNTKPSDLMPELQGRFPIRVELDDLTKEDFIRILTEPDNALIKQYIALLDTEGVRLDFTDEAVEELADIASGVNSRTVNIGARRLYTIMERLLEDISFQAPDMKGSKVEITGNMVKEQLQDIAVDEDLSKYIL